MKIFISLNILITLTNYANSQLLLPEVLNNNVRLAVYPPFIVHGWSFQLDIQCTFKRHTVPSMASVLSMVIAHSNKIDQPGFNYLALVNAMEGHAHNVSHDVDIVSGSIDNNGESKLHMRFREPETNLIGLYMCEVTGFDQIGKPVSIYSAVNVVASNITDLLDLLIYAQSNISTMQSNITDLLDSLHNAQSNLSSMQSCHAAYIEAMHTLQPTLCTNYSPSIFYNGHEYYLSHVLTYFNYTEMQSKCNELGGYLVELDTHEEFSFIRDYLAQLGSEAFVWTGATDENQEGVWINEHNTTSIPTFDWAPGEINSGRDFNCQCFYYRLNWFLVDCLCYPHLGNNKYICEVPRSTC